MEAKQIGETFIQKKARVGWDAKSYFEFDGTAWQLCLHTSKRERGGLSTFATVALHKDGFTRYALFRDYGKTVAEADGKCTDKAVTALHQQAVAMVDEIIADARAHYIRLHAKRTGPSSGWLDSPTIKP